MRKSFYQKPRGRVWLYLCSQRTFPTHTDNPPQLFPDSSRIFSLSPSVTPEQELRVFKWSNEGSCPQLPFSLLLVTGSLLENSILGSWVWGKVDSNTSFRDGGLTHAQPVRAPQYCGLHYQYGDGHRIQFRPVTVRPRTLAQTTRRALGQAQSWESLSLELQAAILPLWLPTERSPGDGWRK